MSYILSIQFPDSHGVTEEKYDDVGYALARAKEIQDMPWTQYGPPSMTLTDSVGAEIDIDKGVYVHTITRPLSAPDPVGEAIAEDAAEREKRKPTIEEKQSLNAEYGRFDGRSPDANVEAVRKQLLDRSAYGFKKYKVTTERKDVDILGWLQHLQEELMDAAVYVQCLKSQIEVNNSRMFQLLEAAVIRGQSIETEMRKFETEEKDAARKKWIEFVLSEMMKKEP